MQDKRLSIDVLMSLPFTIYSSYIEWLRSLQLHLCGPKSLHPQNPLQYGPKPLQNGVKPLLVFGLCVVLTASCPVSSTTSLKILGHVLKTAQLSGSYFPTPTLTILCLECKAGHLNDKIQESTPSWGAMDKNGALELPSVDHWPLAELRQDLKAENIIFVRSISHKWKSMVLNATEDQNVHQIIHW